MRISLLVALAAILSSTSGCDKTATEASGAPGQGTAEENKVRGGQDSKQPYTIEAAGPSSVVSGKETAATVVVRPRSPYKINLEYPLRMTITSPPGASLGKTKLGAADAREFSKQRIQLEPAFTVSRAGTHRFDAELHFSVCTDALCELKREKIHWTARVP